MYWQYWFAGSCVLSAEVMLFHPLKVSGRGKKWIYSGFDESQSWLRAVVSWTRVSWFCGDAHLLVASFQRSSQAPS